MENPQDLEQKNVDAIYARLDQLRIELYSKIAKLKKNSEATTHQNKSEMDSLISELNDQLQVYNSVDQKLVFGKLEYHKTEPKYIGRIGISDENKKPLLYDWRAPISQEFYQATALNPGDIKLRRHINLKNRQIVSIEDEAFDQAVLGEQKLSGEAAIFQSLSARRSNRMNDIVATIQKEQDTIIRSDSKNALVVQGGAGTGKTAVALHRAAYLLYNNREKLSKQGVLLIGPNDKFLFYIDRVLPSLGESGVVSTSIGNLYPNVRTESTDNPIAQRVKGDIRMAQAISNAVNLYVRVPQKPVEFEYNRVTLVITPQEIAEVQQLVKDQKVPHNQGRAYFIKFMIERLTNQYLASGAGFERYEESAAETGGSEKQTIKRALMNIKEVIRTLNYSWMQLLPQKLIRDLFNSKAFVKTVAPWVNHSELRQLVQEGERPFTKSDVPLIDEAAELIGEEVVDTNTAPEDTARFRAIEEMLESMRASGQPNVDLVDPNVLYELENNVAQNILRTRAQRDRTWIYGHVVVDEAQELSQMDYRMLVRRCPNLSFTIVGDVMQTTSSAGARNWNDALKSTFGKNYRIERLTVNYRNPKIVAEKAITVAKASGLKIEQTASARDVPNSFEIRSVGVYEVYEEAAKTAYELSEEFITFGKEGRVAVIVRPEKVDELKQAIFKKIEEDYGQVIAHQISSQKSPDAQLEIISPEDSKGLEFDAVLLVEPLDLQLYDNQGHQTYESMSALYVAMTRPTSRLVLVHFKNLPKGF
ncbi:MAG: AAA family ATPase [Bifidobacteriaceae bacterium]|jgi:DNA helicase IV|nr:AAA family ATPase [Bifidobacteriaceae bacterium]